MDAKESEDADVKIVTKSIVSKRSKGAADRPGDKKESRKARQLTKANRKGMVKEEPAKNDPEKIEPVNVNHGHALDGLPRKTLFKGTLNTHDLMHAPVEKTLQMLDKILSGERLFTM